MKPTENRKELKRKFALWAARFDQKMVSGGQRFFAKRVHQKSNLFLCGLCRQRTEFQLSSEHRRFDFERDRSGKR